MPGLRVLIADDTAEIRLVLRSLLQGDAEIVGEAVNGQDAIDKVEALQPDLVVMDYMMPIMGGIEATREIKRRWPLVEVLGYTSVPFEDATRDMLEAGATESFDKLRVEQLIDAVRFRIPRQAKRTRVLVVDDNADVRQMLVMRLEMTNVDIVGEAVNGRDAVAKVDELEPTVVIMDLQMPEMDGIEATRHIKQRWPEVRVLGYTSFPSDEIREAGASDSFQKTDTEKLIRAVVEFD